MKLGSSDRNNSTETHETKLWEIKLRLFYLFHNVFVLLSASFYGLNHFVVHTLKEVQGKCFVLMEKRKLVMTF